MKNTEEITELKSGIWKLRQIKREREKKMSPLLVGGEC